MSARLYRVLDEICIHLHLQSELLAMVAHGSTPPDKRMAINLLVQNANDVLNEIYLEDEKDAATRTLEDHAAAESKTEIQNPG